MICPNCGQQNMEGSNFCIKCGKSISMTTSASFQNNGSQNVHLNTGVPVQEVVPKNTKSNSSIPIKSFFHSILNVFVKPFSAIKEEVDKYVVLKNSFLLSLILSLFAVAFSLVQAMIRAVVVTSYSIFEGSKTTWVWENLKDVKYLEIVGKNLLLYLGIILGIAAVYYVASMLIKKQVNFSRLLGISALSVVPVYLGILVISPIVSLIYAPLGMVVTIISGVYTFLIFYEAINEEIPLEKEKKFYFHLLCISIAVVIIYFVYMKFFVASSISENLPSGMDDIFDFIR